MAINQDERNAISQFERQHKVKYVFQFNDYGDLSPLRGDRGNYVFCLVRQICGCVPARVGVRAHETALF